MVVINPAEFARRGETREGKLAVSSLPRLADLVIGNDSVLEWRAAGSVEPAGVISPSGWFLTLQVAGAVPLRCQRCLDVMMHPVAVSSRLLMLPQSRPLPDDELEEDRFDAIPVGEELDLAALIEEELLLSLPAVPRHEQCAPPQRQDDKDGASPFAVLAQLKRGH